LHREIEFCQKENGEIPVLEFFLSLKHISAYFCSKIRHQYPRTIFY